MRMWKRQLMGDALVVDHVIPERREVEIAIAIDVGRGQRGEPEIFLFRSVEVKVTGRRGIGENRLRRRQQGREQRGQNSEQDEPALKSLPSRSSGSSSVDGAPGHLRRMVAPAT